MGKTHLHPIVIVRLTYWSGRSGCYSLRDGWSLSILKQLEEDKMDKEKCGSKSSDDADLIVHGVTQSLLAFSTLQ